MAAYLTRTNSDSNDNDTVLLQPINELIVSPCLRTLQVLRESTIIIVICILMNCMIIIDSQLYIRPMMIFSTKTSDIATTNNDFDFGNDVVDDATHCCRSGLQSDSRHINL